MTGSLGNGLAGGVHDGSIGTGIVKVALETLCFQLRTGTVGKAGWNYR